MFDDRGRRRRRRGIFRIIVKWLVVLALIVGAGFYAYDIGTKLAREDVRRMEDRMTELRDENSRLRTELAGQQAALRTERDRAAQLQERYARDVPAANEQAVMALVRKRVGEGVTPARLAEVVAGARNEAACPDPAATRRFVVQSPLYRGPNDAVSFADGTIVITASGESAKNAQGQPEAWYDPALPVKVRFTHVGGQAIDAEGPLPLHRTILAGGWEYRFSLVAGNRAFANITVQRCR